MLINNIIFRDLHFGVNGMNALRIEVSERDVRDYI